MGSTQLAFFQKANPCFATGQGFVHILIFIPRLRSRGVRSFDFHVTVAVEVQQPTGALIPSYWSTLFTEPGGEVAIDFVNRGCGNRLGAYEAVLLSSPSTSTQAKGTFAGRICPNGAQIPALHPEFSSCDDHDSSFLLRRMETHDWPGAVPKNDIEKKKHVDDVEFRWPDTAQPPWPSPASCGMIGRQRAYLRAASSRSRILPGLVDPSLFSVPYVS
jgi:hypothetical protein